MVRLLHRLDPSSLYPQTLITTIPTGGTASSAMRLEEVQMKQTTSTNRSNHHHFGFFLFLCKLSPVWALTQT